MSDPRIFTADRHKSKADRHKPRKGDRHKPRKGDRHKGQHTGRSYRCPFPPEFIAVDGEGKDLPNGKHVYTLLAASDGQYIERSKGLHTAEIFRWLLDLKERHPRAKIVGFALNYDVNKWLVDLHRNDLEGLNDTNVRRFWIDGQAYRLEWLPSKWFLLSERHYDREKADWITDRSVRITDVFGFFQARFVKTINDSKDGWRIGTPEQWDRIEGMKQKRGEFRKETPADIRRYCLEECELLVELMNAFGQSLVEAGIRISSWHGAGAIANAILKEHDIKLHLEGDLPPAVRTAVMSADFGGRIQLLKVGEFAGGVWGHDINSAYPSVNRELPSWAGVRIEKLTRFADDPWTLYHVRWQVADDFSPTRERILTPFPFRYPDGRIEFPLNGEGWYWYPEVKAALEIWPRKIKILGGFRFIPASGEKPFAFVNDIYAKRIAFKAAGRPAQKPVKLGMNSLYGKLAQATRNPERPAPYQSYINAGYITSSTRAKLLRLAALDPEAIIFFATDGVFATRKLVENDPGKPLGGWEVDDDGRLFVLQSGVYHFPDGPSKHKPKTRGFNPELLDFDNLRALWKTYGIRWRAMEGLAVAKRRTFIGLGYAANTGDWESWGQWPEKEREIRPDFKGLTVEENANFYWAEETGATRDDLYQHLPIKAHYQIVQLENSSDDISAPYEPKYTPTVDERNEKERLEMMLALDNADADNPAEGDEG